VQCSAGVECNDSAVCVLPMQCVCTYTCVFLSLAYTYIYMCVCVCVAGDDDYLEMPKTDTAEHRFSPGANKSDSSVAAKVDQLRQRLSDEIGDELLMDVYR
jgi:hypothetical protein